MTTISLTCYHHGMQGIIIGAIVEYKLDTLGGSFDYDIAMARLIRMNSLMHCDLTPDLLADELIDIPLVCGIEEVKVVGVSRRKAVIVCSAVTVHVQNTSVQIAESDGHLLIARSKNRVRH